MQADLGFPAGKNKTMLIDLRPAAGATRLRLRTNLEVYWDAMAVATRVEAPLRVTRLAASSAELRYRGFSRTTSPRGDSPETPEVPTAWPASRSDGATSRGITHGSATCASWWRASTIAT